MMHLSKLSIIILLLFCVSQNGNVYSQDRRGVSVSFINSDTEGKIGDFSSNVLRIINNTGREQKLNIMVNPPAGWSLFGASLNEIILPVNDSLFVPVRVKQGGDMKGDMTYVTNAFVMSNGFTVGNAVWNISITKQSKWYAKTSANKVYFSDGADTASFFVNLTNGGNSEERLVLKAVPEQGLYIKNAKGELLSDFMQRITLDVGQDTVIVFTVKRDDALALPTDNQNGDEKTYRLGLFVDNEVKSVGSRGSWHGRVSFAKLSDKKKIKNSPFASFPLTLEFNGYNVLTDNTYATLGLYGYHELGKNRSLSYYYQGSFIKNQFEWRTYLGNYFYVGYFSEAYRAEIGDITSGRSGSRLIGKGLKASAKREHHELGGLYIGNPSPFNDPTVKGGGVFYNYTANKLLLETYYESSKNLLRDVNTNYFTADASYNLTRGHVLRFGGGFSTDNYNLFLQKYTGYRAMLGYSGYVKKINLNFNGRYSSPHYSSFRGNTSLNATVGYPIKQMTRLSAGASYYHNQPAVVMTDGTVSDSVYTGRNTFFIQLSHSVENNTFIFKPEYTMYKSYWLDVNTAGVNYDYRTRASHNMSFFASVFVGGNGYPTYEDINPIFVSTVRLSLRYKHFNTNIRYYYGPYYLNEHYYYVNTLQNPQRFFAMAFYDWWFARNHMDLKTNLNYNYATMYKRHQLVLRPELFYYTKSRFQFSIYLSYMLFANGEYERFNTRPNYAPVRSSYYDEIVPAGSASRIETGFGIKFNFNMPVGRRKNYNAVMVVFRDANGNGIKDRDEQGFANMLIKVTKVNESFTEEDEFVQAKDIYELITDEEGVVEYKYLPKGNYKIESMPLSANQGWFGKRTMYKFIDGNSTIYIPLSKGAKISGGIFVERDVHSDNEPVNIGGIRVTVVNQLTGETYTTLTDQNGNYSLHVPNGDYVVTINEGAVGTRFSFLDNDIPISVKSSGKSYNVGFYLSEKKRTVRFGRGQGLRDSPIKDNRNGAPKTTGTGAESDLIQVSDSMELSNKYAIKLFASERQRMLRTEFDTLQNVTNVYCIKGNGGMYNYFTSSFKNKGASKKLLKTVMKLGFSEATLVEIKNKPAIKPEKIKGKSKKEKQ